MRRPSRIRRFSKWTGLGLCILVLVVLVLSGWWQVLHITHEGSQLRQVALYQGILLTARLDSIDEVVNDLDERGHYGWHLKQQRLQWQLHPKFSDWPSIQNTGNGHILTIPLWLPFALIALPTAWLWWRDRRIAPAGHCQQCGYNLTGNATGVCPECGGAAERSIVKSGERRV